MTVKLKLNRTIKAQHGGEVRTIFQDLTQRLSEPFGGPVGAAIAHAMRFGEGSIDAQFAGEGMIGNTGGRQAWPRPKFGGGRAMHRSGKLRQAWLGGFGSITDVGDDYVRVGVADGSLPYAKVFQKRGAFIKGAPAGGDAGTTASGRLPMQLAIGLKHGIWISEAKLLSGVRIDPRPVSVNPQMMHRVQKIALGWVATGEFQQARRAA